MISVWFDRRRGLALGITLAGLGFGGFWWPLLSQWSIDTFGWRNAYLVVAATIAIVGMSAVALVVRDSPQSMGLLPDGADRPRSISVRFRTIVPGALPYVGEIRHLLAAVHPSERCRK